MLDFIKNTSISRTKHESSARDPTKNNYVNIISDNVKLLKPANHSFKEENFVKGLIEI